MLTIFKTTVHVTSQEQADRLKQICIDYGLPIWTVIDDAFTLRPDRENFFECVLGSFVIHDISVGSETIITESEWMELLTKTKKL